MTPKRKRKRNLRPQSQDIAIPLSRLFIDMAKSGIKECTVTINGIVLASKPIPPKKGDPHET